MSKRTVLINNKETYSCLITTLTDTLGYPSIKRRLMVYMFNPDGMEASLQLSNNTCKFKITNRNEKALGTDYVYITNKNIKYFFKYLQALGFKRTSFNSTIVLSYQTGETTIDIIKNSLIGDIVQIENNEALNSELSKLFLDLKLELLTDENLDKYVNEIKITKYDLFNSYGILNSKLRDEIETLGFDLSSSTLSLQDRIKSVSNNYSSYEMLYEDITKCELLGLDSYQKIKDISPVTVIVPSFNSERTIIKCLHSIEAQNLTKKELKNIEVIVIDDGSKIPVIKEINKRKFTFDLKVIRLEKNQGLSIARNLGVNVAKNENLIFLDSDIILSPNYLQEMAIRLDLIPNALFVSFKRNVELEDEVISDEAIKIGLERPGTYDDIRLSRIISKERKGIYTLDQDKLVEALDDSNFFKSFGYGRQIGIFDLATMVIGHNMCLRKTTVKEADFFSTHFKGWGMEDAYFGSKVIANGNFVIPVLSTGVYHINHEPRSGSEENKAKEYAQNIETYKDLLRKEIYVIE